VALEGYWEEDFSSSGKGRVAGGYAVGSSAKLTGVTEIVSEPWSEVWSGGLRPERSHFRAERVG